MNPLQELLRRNERFVERYEPGQSPIPRLRMCIVCCPDPRVDPTTVFGLELGDAAVVRAAAGRVSPIVLQQLLFLQATGAVAGAGDAAFELMLMQHSDCGIKHFTGPEQRDGLAAFLGCTVDELEAKAVTDPHAAVRVDIETLAANPLIPDALSVTGVVYDVDTGRVEVVERRSPLRPEQARIASTSPPQEG
jgi:carbonic anhydrase